MTRLATLLTCLSCHLASAQGFNVGGPTQGLGVVSIVPTALPNGTLQLAVTMSDGTVQTMQTTAPVNGISRAFYDPISYPITSGSAAQLRDGYSVFTLSGSGLLTTATIKLPANPVDGQIARVVLPPGLSITSLAFQSGAGLPVATLASVVGGSTPLLQWQNTAWLKIGS